MDTLAPNQYHPHTQTVPRPKYRFSHFHCGFGHEAKRFADFPTHASESRVCVAHIIENKLILATAMNRNMDHSSI